jgi:hypothetical protein
VALARRARAAGAVPHVALAGADADTQALLRRIAAETVLAYSPRQWCPADPLAP